MFAWQVLENGEWNLVAASDGDGAIMPLVTMREPTFHLLQPIATAHSLATGLPVRGVRYDDPMVLEEIK